MKTTEDPEIGLRGLIGKNSPAENLIKEKEIGETDPDQDPPEEISAGAILNQDSEVRVLIPNIIKEIQEEIREETDRDSETDKDPRQPEIILHHLQQEELTPHFLQNEIHHHFRDNQDHRIMTKTGEGLFPVVQQAEIVLFLEETETEKEIPDQDTTHLLITKERTVLSTIK